MHKLSLLLEAAGLPRSTYYYYAKHREKSEKYKEIKEQITEIYKEIAA
jgi:putative transposase